LGVVGNSLKDALAYYTIKLRLKVIPLHDMSAGHCSCDNLTCGKNGGKHPRIKDWPNSASNSFDRIFRDWWARWPNANIGVPTGQANGFFAIDVDDVQALESLLSDGRVWPLTYSYRTGSGNRHYWFKYPENRTITNSRGKLPLGIDVRGNGGYLVVPPSVTQIGPYLMEEEQAIAPAPEWLLMLLDGLETAVDAVVPESGVPVWGDLETTLQERLKRYTQGVIANEVEALHELVEIQGLQWDNGTYRSACNLFELAKAPWAPLTSGEAETIIREHAPPFDDEGWDQFRLDKLIASAFKRIFHSSGVRPMPDLKSPEPSQPLKGNPKEILSSSLVSLRFSEIEDEKYEWFEENWLPKKGVVLVAGNPGSGKSTLFAHWITELTKGRMSGRPESVVYVVKEDSAAAIIKPRLAVAGADLDRVWTLYVQEPDFNEQMKIRSINLKRHLVEIREFVRANHIKAIFMDPIVSFLGVDEDRDSKDMQRTALEDLLAFADSENVLILGIKHFKKNQKGSERLSGRDRLYGSTVWSEVLRHILILRQMDDELREKLELGEDDTTSALLHIDKNSYGPNSLPPKAFRLEEGIYNGQVFMAFEPDGTREFSSKEIDEREIETFEQADKRIEKETSSDDWLVQRIKAAGGSISRVRIEEMSKDRGAPTMRTIDRRVKRLEQLGRLIVTKESGTTNKIVMWTLPGQRAEPRHPIDDLDA
jgi:RecA-family ATPase